MSRVTMVKAEGAPSTARLHKRSVFPICCTDWEVKGSEVIPLGWKTAVQRKLARQEEARELSGIITLGKAACKGRHCQLGEC